MAILSLTLIRMGIMITEVVLYSIVNGGHAWPGGKKGSEKGDEPTQEISANRYHVGVL